MRELLIINASVLSVMVAYNGCNSVAQAQSFVAQAQGFPTRPVTLIVPWPAGGTTDIAVRALAAATQKTLGQSIVIENRAGASGSLGLIQMAATAKPDGYTVAQIPLSLFRFVFMTKTTFDPTKDLSYVIGLTGYSFGVVVRTDAPWKTFEELLADAKARPGTISYGSPGAGTTPHIVMTQIAKQKGINWVHVPFKGTSETINAILGGHIDAVADGSSWGPMVNEGKLRLLVTFGPGRTTNWPTVPTLNRSPASTWSKTRPMALRVQGIWTRRSSKHSTMPSRRA